MMNFITKFRVSFGELKKVRTLAAVSLLTALGVLLGFFALLPSETLRFSLNFLVTASMGFLFGPVPAALGASAIDLLLFVLRPTGPYFIGFTLDAALGGLLYGMILYHAPVKFWRALLSKALVNIFINSILATIWLGVLYGKSITVLIPARLLKNLLSLPAESAVLFLVLLGVGKAWKRAVRR